MSTDITPPLPTLSPHFTGLDITPVRPAYQCPSPRSSEKRQRSVSPDTDTRRKLTSPREHTPRDRTPKSQDRTPKSRRPGLHERSCFLNSQVNIFKIIFTFLKSLCLDNHSSLCCDINPRTRVEFIKSLLNSKHNNNQ